MFRYPSRQVGLAYLFALLSILRPRSHADSIETTPDLSTLSGDAENWFPDHDCIRRVHSDGAEQPLLNWSHWLHELERPGDEGLLQRSAQALVALEPGRDGATASEYAFRMQAAAECRIGLLMADVLRALTCYGHIGGAGPEQDKCYDGFDARVREGLSELGMRILIGTRWPIYDALNSQLWAKGATNLDLHGVDCRGIENPLLNWHAFMQVFDDADWYQRAVDVAYGPELERAWRSAAEECPLGFVVANLIKAMLCSHTESICFRAHSIMVGELLRQTPMHLIANSGWPIFTLLPHISRAVRRHRFYIDFTPDEMLPVGIGTAVPMAQHYSPHVSSSMKDLVALLPLLQPTEFAAVDSTGAFANAQLRLVYVTMAHGPRFSPYVSRFVERARALGAGSALLVFCLDDDACASCRAADGLCLAGTPSILNKFTLPLVLLFEGLDVMWLDLDVFLFQEPAPYVAQQVFEGDYELLISGAFAVDCICSGIVVYRATDRTRRWLAELLSWMYEHPYEHDQKAFSAFLRAGERVAFDHELPLDIEKTPRWTFLDPETAFVSARHVDDAGWTGDPDKIVAFHLLHGDSDDAAASRQFAARNSLGIGYTPLLDLFFNRTDIPELYSTPVLPHHVSDELKDALLQSRWPSRPTERRQCNETVPMQY